MVLYLDVLDFAGVAVLIVGGFVALAVAACKSNKRNKR